LSSLAQYPVKKKVNKTCIYQEIVIILYIFLLLASNIKFMDKFTLFSTVFLLLVSTLLFSQTETDIKNKILPQTNVFYLNDLSSRLLLKSTQRKEIAVQKAIEKGWAIRQEVDGVLFEIMDLDELGMPIYYTTHNVDAAKTVSTNKVYTGGGLGLSLDGTNMKAGVWDGGTVRTTHQEFNNTGTPRVTNIDASATHYHATHVAGTIAAGGVQANAKGMAFNASIDAYDWNNDLSQMATAATNGLLISNHSYGNVAGWAWGDYANLGSNAWYWFGTTSISGTEDFVFGFYNSQCANYDNLAINAPYYLIVKSAGNDAGQGPAPETSHYVRNSSGNWISSSTVRQKDGGTNGYDCIPTWGNAKNILTVGAVSDIVNGYAQPSDVVIAWFSSRGPTDDGRIKPDVVGNGVGLYSTQDTTDIKYLTLNGTSMSAPNVTGSLLLLQQHHNNLYSSYMLAATLKALSIHTADEAGANEGPDYFFGWGLLNTATAAQLISNKDQTSYIKEESLSNGNTYTFQVTATGTEPLMATIVWADPAGTPPANSLNPTTKMLVNDLDLRITKSASTYYPYVLDRANPANAATKADNSIDNVEKIYIASPDAGDYTITVTHKGTLTSAPQAFSLIVSGISNAYAVVTTDDVTNLKSSSAQIAGEVHNDAGFTITERGFVYNTTGNPTVNDNKVVVGSGTGAFSTTITGLNPNTSYYVKAYAINATGTAYGNQLQFTTLCELVTVFPFLQDFNAAASCPACWSIVDNQGNGQTWKFGVFNPKWDTQVFFSNTAYLDSDGYGNGGVQNADLISPEYDFSGYTNVNLSFQHYFREYMTEYATLSYSTNNGSSWTQLQQWTSYTANPATYSNTIPALANQSQVRFKWNYQGSWGYYWIIDDVQITATAANSLTVSNQTQTLDANMAYQNVTVNFDGELTVDENVILTITGDLIVKSDENGSGSFIDLGKVLVSGNATVEKFIDVDNEFGTTVTSPVNTANANVFSGHFNTYYYEPTLNNWLVFDNGTMETMKGYWTKFNTDKTLLFNNNFNTGDYTFTNFIRTNVDVGTGNFGWNFIGNPYPSGLFWDDVVAQNGGASNFTATTKLNNAIYINKGDGSYYHYNGIGTGFPPFDGIIPPATAFWVQVNKNYFDVNNPTDPIDGAHLKLSNTARKHISQSKKNEQDFNMLRVYLSNDLYTDDIVIRLHPNASLNFDNNFDAYKMEANNNAMPQLYMLNVNNEKIAIDALPETVNQPLTIPLGITKLNQNLHTLSFNNTHFNSTLSVHLEDKFLDKIIDVTQLQSYNFVSGNQTEDSRFLLHFGLTSSANPEAPSQSTDPSAYLFDNTLYVNNPNHMLDVSIYNVLGQCVYEKTLYKGISHHKLVLPNAYYIVKLQDNKTSISLKVFVD